MFCVSVTNVLLRYLPAWVGEGETPPPLVREKKKKKNVLNNITRLTATALPAGLLRFLPTCIRLADQPPGTAAYPATCHTNTIAIFILVPSICLYYARDHLITSRWMATKERAYANICRKQHASSARRIPDTTAPPDAARQTQAHNHQW